MRYTSSFRGFSKIIPKKEKKKKKKKKKKKSFTVPIYVNAAFG